MVRAVTKVERVNCPSPGAMTKTLFLDNGWGVVVAQRLARLSGGDWRQLRALEVFFSNVSIAQLSDDKFQRKCQGTKVDKNPLLDSTPCKPFTFDLVSVGSVHGFPHLQ